jgi:tetratricopeptide (TPR) repeat protein
MAKIPLRAYNREIEGLIDQGQTLEAVAHCQHILKTFPKCLDTYRLLGKAYLELQRFVEAGDVFNRLLLAVPEDFIANLGMSIIYDDQKNLDAAIWHMERAFETQSSNPAIQGELRRLYNRRDGMEPPKIRLTRGALAQMYAKGDQFPQAIAEIRSVLAEEPQRMDLQVLLARVFYRAGQKVETTEICTSLLKRYPYCLDANRVLVEILPGTSRAENTQVYRHRVNALDPYSAFATPTIFNAPEVADAAVTMERLLYQADAWAPANYGLESVKDQATPEWLTTKEAPAGEETPIEPVSEENIPDWMKAAGWAATSAAAAEAVERASNGSVVQPETPVISDEITSGEVPDWLKMMAPPGALDQAAHDTGPETPVSNEDLNWLESLGTPGVSAPIEQPEQPMEHLPQESSSALGGIIGAGAAVGAMFATRKDEEQEQVSPPPPAQPSEEKPDWLSQLGGPTADASFTAPAPSAQPAEELPDWLTGATSGPVSSEVSNRAHAGLADSELPDWLKGADEGGASVDQTLQSIETAPGTTAAADSGLPVSEDDAFAWLESLAAKQGAKPEELLTKPEDRPGETPDWLEKLSEGEKPAEPGIGMAGVGVAAGAAASLFEEEKPEEIGTAPIDKELFAAPPLSTGVGEVMPEQAAHPTEIPAQAMSDDDAFSWLESLAARQGAKSEELLTKPEDRAESAPEWATHMGIEAAPGSDGQPVKPPSEKKTLESVLPELGMEQQGDLSWLQAIGGDSLTRESTIGEPTIEEDVFAQPPSESIFDEKPAVIEPVVNTPLVESATADEVAEWLQKLEAEDLPRTTEPEQKSAFVTEELPDWLKEEEPAETPSAELPDWLRGETGEQPAAVAALQDEWKPEQSQADFALEEKAAELVPQVEAVLPLRPPKTPSASAEKDAGLFENSQLELQRGNLTEAMQGYGKLIKRGKMLDEIIFDLREAFYRHPVDVVIWQTLGDAYMRANRLQDALDAYTKAEELLR